MASIIRVKRSTGVIAPSPLNFGEVGLTVGVGTYGNKGGRLFAGDNANNPQEVGGRYYTDMMSIEAGKLLLKITRQLQIMVLYQYFLQWHLVIQVEEVM